MRRLTLLLFIIFLSFENFGQSIDRYEISPRDKHQNPKEIITSIRNGNIECLNLEYNDTIISFNSKNKLTFEDINSIVEISYFNKSKTIDLNANTEKAGGVNCSNAEMICSNSSFSANSSGSGTQELNSTNRGCLLNNENQSSWYYVYAQTAGTLTMTIQPTGGNADYDFAIWGPFTEANAEANCPPTSGPTRCSYADNCTFWFFGCLSYSNNTGMNTAASDLSEDAGGDGFVRRLDVLAGQVYIMLIDNFTANSRPYNLNWGGSATLGCVPIVLGADITSFTGKKEGTTNVVSWTTSSEKNNDYFLLEHSTDGETWNVISKEYGAGNSSQIKNYYYIHRDFPKTTNYYRLIQVDFDGKKSYYSVIPIDNSSDRKVIKVLNTLGQEVDQNYKGMVIEYYDDNTYSKRVQ